MRGAIITLLTDFGTSDYYVGAVKGTLLRLAGEASLIDITHGIEPGNVVEGAFVLAAAARSFPPETIHLAVVDPGVGSARRILAARHAAGYFVGPDNGLLDSFLGDAEVRNVQAKELFLEGAGDTFHGRDRFAPVAAYLAGGHRFESLGEAIEDAVRLTRQPPRRTADSLAGRVVHIDRFGNLVTDIPSGWLADRNPAEFTSRVGGLEVRRLVSHYDQLPPGEAAFLPGSTGTLEISIRDQSAAEVGRVRRGRTLEINFR